MDATLTCKWHHPSPAKAAAKASAPNDEDALTPRSGEDVASASPPQDGSAADADGLYDDVAGEGYDSGGGGHQYEDGEDEGADNEVNVDYDYDEEDDMVDYD